jgi:hypothetical protein
VTQDDLLRTDGAEKPADAQGQPLLDDRVEDAVALAALGDQTGALEDAEMAGDGRPADGEPARDC